MLVVSPIILATQVSNLTLITLGLILFFTGFSLLEAFLPSLVSRTAPPKQRGTALGIYSCSQFLGIFVGGTIGGWLYGAFGLLHVYLFCVVFAIAWLAISFKKNNPPKHSQYLHPSKPNFISTYFI